MTHDDEYRGVGLISRLSHGSGTRLIAYVAIIGLVIPVVVGALVLLR